MTNFITITANAKRFHPISCQKEIGMLSSEWQTLSQSQPMQKGFIQFLAKLYHNHSQCKKFSSNFLPKGNTNDVKWMTNLIIITTNANKFHSISCQKEKGMLPSEWQTLSLSQLMQTSFIQFLAKRKKECCLVNDKLYHNHSQCKQNKFHPISCEKEIGMLSSEWQTL